MIQNLGQIVGETLAVIEGHAGDPISAQCGIYGDPAPEVQRILDRHGVTAEAVIDELDIRLSPKCSYEFAVCVAVVLDEIRQAVAA